MNPPYGISRTTSLSFDQASQRIREALKAQGFGVLTEIDVQATLKEKLDADTEPYIILGACNPPLAHRAISAEPSIGLFLPCNVVIRQQGDTVLVEAMDPEAAMGLVDNPEIKVVATEARQKLLAAIDSFEG
jgi:uncharacterized protein (DUF302 family)